MGHENRLALRPCLESVRQQFERWRETKKSPRESIPEHLWEAASKLHSKYPLSRISKALRLNHTDLKKRTSGQKANRRAKKKSWPLFVELDRVDSFTASECMVEMEDAFGSKMRMRFKGKADLDLLELCRAFWKRGK
ncbi:MAG: hypothetical protein AB8I58_01245 [Anaerolineales bacterium]|jgi:hypothetical protein